MDGQTPKRKFAVFDIDGTVMRTSLLQLMSRELVARGKLDITIGHEIDVRLHDYRQKISDEKFGSYMEDSARILFSNLKNLPVDEYLQVARAIANRSLSNSYVYTRELINNLKKHGYLLITISGSELRLVQTFSQLLGIDVAIGSVFYRGEETLTGEVEVISHPKSEILTALIQKYSLDTKGSLAVGDTSSDAAMLSMVETPIAFNPNRELLAIAKEKGWMVVIERKDVVYGLTQKDGQYILSQTNV